MAEPLHIRQMVSSLAGATVGRVNPGLRIGRIFGIPLEINWSWLVVFGLITWTLATGVFPAQNPGLAKSTYYGMAVAAALLFFVSLLLHELGHAMVARREGLEIEGITLWLFGGVARFRSNFPSAGAELRIAAAGPFVTLVLGGIFVALAKWAPVPSAIDGVVAWLGYINLFLLAFNLLPALPLDGGRIFRSLLWKFKGDYAWATVIAAAAGRLIGGLMIAGGIALLVLRGAFSGAWLAFIGWFLIQASTSERRTVAVHDALGALTVRNVMTRDPVTVEPDDELGTVIDEMPMSDRHTSYPVVDDGRVLGLLSFAPLAAVPRGEWEHRHVRQFLLDPSEVPVLDPDVTAIDALATLQGGHGRRALVLEDGRLVGIVSISDLAHAVELRGSLVRR